MATLNFTGEIAKSKCGLGKMAECCSFLAVGPGGFECLFVSGLRATIEKRRASGAMNAKGGPCKDPHDPTDSILPKEPTDA